MFTTALLDNVFLIMNKVDARLAYLHLTIRENSRKRHAFLLEPQFEHVFGVDVLRRSTVTCGTHWHLVSQIITVDTELFKIHK